MKIYAFLIAVCIQCYATLPVFASDGVPKEKDSSVDPQAATTTLPTSDGFHLTPAMLTVNSSDTSKDAKTTPGLEFDFKREWKHMTTGTPNGWSTTLKGDGRAAFDHNQHVGDLIDIGLDYSYTHFLIPDIGPNFTLVSPGYGYIKAGLKAGVQTSQSFDTKQKIVAFEARGMYTLAKYVSPAFVNAFPEIVLGYERVNPTGDNDRAKIDPGLSAYNRLHASLRSSIILGSINEGRKVKLELNVSHWRELGASSAMDAASLSRQTYRAIGLRESDKDGNKGWNLTYSSGKVPTDKATAAVWQLGYTFNVESL